MLPTLEPEDGDEEVPDDLRVSSQQERRGTDREVPNEALVIVEVWPAVVPGSHHTDTATLELHDGLTEAVPGTGFEIRHHALGSSAARLADFGL
jgi:hypothetical protein